MHSVRWYLWSLLFASPALADYYIDNANTSVVYSMAPSASGTAWKTFSVDTQALVLQIGSGNNITNITIDASKCYDDNYALGVCGTNDNCHIQIPFVGSGIMMYMLNAGFEGVTASVTVDNSPPVTSSLSPPPGPTYQIPNTSMFDVQSLPTGSHNLILTVLDWNNGASSMYFDYALVNETFVATPTTTTTTVSQTSSTSSTLSASQTSSGTPTPINTSGSTKIDVGGAVGGAVAGIAVLAAIILGILYLRKRKKATTSQESMLQATPWQEDPHTHPLPPAGFLYSDNEPPIQPGVRTAILRDALAGTNYPSTDPLPSTYATASGTVSKALEPLRRQPSGGFTPSYRRSASYSDPDPTASLRDTSIASQYNLTGDQLEMIERLQSNNVPADTIARVAEEMARNGGRPSFTDRGSSGGLARTDTIFSAPPPSYQSRSGR
ncbi:hypothetical protein F5I97DRAFT_626078 [Phlebopus sp. FC_14]|nr:hypothetical protein F5I97DRAFT_626078 [Phlebopus sp. FC_14]